MTGLPEVAPGDDLAGMIARAVRLLTGDVVVVTQKVVSKAEGRIVAVDPADGQSRVALAEQEAVRVLRRRGELLITETSHGFVCANSGVDHSNIAEGHAALLPVDSDRSARRIPRRAACRGRCRGCRHRLGHLRAPVALRRDGRGHRLGRAFVPSSTCGEPKTSSAGRSWRQRFASWTKSPPPWSSSWEDGLGAGRRGPGDRAQLAR